MSSSPIITLNTSVVTRAPLEKSDNLISSNTAHMERSDVLHDVVALLKAPTRGVSTLKNQWVNNSRQCALWTAAIAHAWIGNSTSTKKGLFCSNESAHWSALISFFPHFRTAQKSKQKSNLCPSRNPCATRRTLKLVIHPPQKCIGNKCHAFPSWPYD